MIQGYVTQEREAIVELTLISETGDRYSLTAAIDTGFTGFLALPSIMVAKLGSIRAGSRIVELADGSLTELPTYLVGLVWNDRLRSIRAYSADGGALIGMGLLYGSRVSMDVIDGGAVEIDPL